MHPFGRNIYIPLCFYYFHFKTAHSFNGITFTFHYVSIISERRLQNRKIRNNIYIPLCFYYFGGGLQPRSDGEGIYIPLCFYYFGSLRPALLLFSFIYIPLCFYYFSLLPCRCSRILQYLHSIMFLLFRNTVSKRLTKIDIYIPLCFYYF